MKLSGLSIVIAALAVSHLAVAQECGTGSFGIAGSSTVYPIAAGWAEAYIAMCPGIEIKPIDDDGSSAGAARVCDASDEASAVEIGDMSRQWRDEEAVVEADGYTYNCVAGDTSRSAIQIDVALDGISVVASGGGIAASCIESMGGLTIDQLRWMFSSYTDSELQATGWDPKSLSKSDGNETTRLWSELDASCDASEVMVSGLNDTHGTFEYLSETIFADMDNGETFTSSYATSPLGPEGTVAYVEENTAAVGYFGYAYYYQNGIELYASAIQNDQGDFVTPGADSVVDGTYNPLSRTIYMNVLADPESLAKTAPFLQFGFSSDGTDIVSMTGYVPIPNPSEMLARLPTTSETVSEGETESSATAASGGPLVTAAVLLSMAVLT